MAVVGLLGPDDEVTPHRAQTEVKPEWASDEDALSVNGRDLLLEEFDEAKATANFAIYIMVIMIAGYAAITVVNTLASSMTGRRREFGLQRLAGSTRTQVRQMVSLEGVMVELSGIVLGTAGPAPSWRRSASSAWAPCSPPAHRGCTWRRSASPCCRHSARCSCPPGGRLADGRPKRHSLSSSRHHRARAPVLRDRGPAEAKDPRAARSPPPAARRVPPCAGTPRSVGLARATHHADPPQARTSSAVMSPHAPLGPGALRYGLRAVDGHCILASDPCSVGSAGRRDHGDGGDAPSTRPKRGSHPAAPGGASRGIVTVLMSRRRRVPSGRWVVRAASTARSSASISVNSPSVSHTPTWR